MKIKEPPAPIRKAAEYRTGVLCAVFGISRVTCNRWIDSGYVRGYRMPGPRAERRVTHHDLMDFFRTHPEYRFFADRIVGLGPGEAGP